jgi:ABC-type multidrug transport system ATPase subunit
MSEEILKALMQLFAILAKQDDGVEKTEVDFVKNFLKQQLNEEAVDEYLKLFYKHAGLDSNGNEVEDSKSKDGEKKRKLTSVKDSVRILGICKKINKTLTQEQKVVVLVRLFELINEDRKFTEQRIAIINTVSDVFKLNSDEFKDIETFVVKNDHKELDIPSILMINNGDNERANNKQIVSEQLSGNILILQIKSVDLYFLRYTGNDNVLLNGLPISNKRIYLFASGASIKPAKGKPSYYSDIVSYFMADTSLSKISYEVENLGYTFKTGDVGLHDMSFSQEHGKLVGIMGASGAGKTTLLNVLSGINSPTSGTVKINGLDLHKEREKLDGVIGVIPQDDLLIEELTVFENLYYNAKLCFKDKTEDEIVELVDKTLDNLGLLERKDLKVGSPLNKMISGGQRKRLNIALELIREPSILFVDEPTSGLSSRDSENVMDLLRELTLKGKLIFVVIHQPSSDIYKMFDNMLILDTGGYLIYQGNPVEAIMYFKRIDQQINSDVGECSTCGNVNPELIFNIVESQVVDEFGKYTGKRKVSPQNWNDHYNENITINDIENIDVAPPKNLNIQNRLKQLFIYTKRDFLSKISNKQYIFLNLLETPLLGFILAYVIRYIADPNSDVYIFRENENINIYIFMAIIVSLFVGLTVSAEEIFKDRKILKRESFLKLSRSSYLLSKVIILTTLSAIQTVTFVVIANTILGIEGMTFAYWFALFSVAVFANFLGLNISATFNSAVTIYIIIPLLMIPMMILSGAMFSFDKLNRSVGSVDRVPIIADMMVTKWAYEALVVSQYKDNNFQKHFYELEKRISNADFKQVYYIPELKEYAQDAIKMYSKKDRDERRYRNTLKLLRNEIEIQTTAIKNPGFPELDKINVAEFTPELGDAIIEYTQKLKSIYATIFAKADSDKDNIINYIASKDKKAYLRQKDKYYNDNLADYVKKVFEKNPILTANNHLVQQLDPIYLDPIPRGYLNFRSHFLAPRKHFAGHYFDTYSFNMTIIWIMSLIMYITLYFESLKKLLTLGEKLKLKRKRD